MSSPLPRRAIEALRAGAALLPLLLAPTAADAHALDYMAIRTHLDARGTTLTFRTDLNFPFDFGPGGEAPLDAMASYFRDAFSIEQRGEPCDVSITEVKSTVTPPRTHIAGWYACPRWITRIEDLRITSALFADLFTRYDHFVDAAVGSSSRSLIFTPSRQVFPDAFPSTASSSPGLAHVLEQFVGLGVMHILSGVDHLLFLLAVVLVLRSFRRTLLLVTSFTIAHSLTLILAGLGLITLTSRIVEPVIAFSIAFMAARNLLVLRSAGDDRHIATRWLATFGFGLVHGLGFAGALAAVEIPRRYFLPALVTFNVGVELGQLMVLAAVLPGLGLLEERPYRLPILRAVSGAIALVALFWCVQRLRG